MRYFLAIFTVCVLATVGILALAVVGSWLAMSLARFPKDWLTVPNTGAVVFVLFLTFVAPSVISTAICYSVASTDNRYAGSAGAAR